MYAITGWLVAGVFQGLFTVIMCYVGINVYTIEISLHSKVLLAGALTPLMLWANYPMTQVYQHEEDFERGGHTISLLLGIRGTFYFVGGIFALVAISFLLYFNRFFGVHYTNIFVVALAPVILFFSIWFLRILKNENLANY